MTDTEASEHQQGFLHEVLKGDLEAISFCNVLFSVSQLLDDLADQDKSIDVRYTVERVAWSALCQLPCHPFYQRHFVKLMPLIRAAVIDWINANALEREDSPHAKQLAYVLRDTVSSLLIHIVGLVHGDEWMLGVSLAIRQHIHDEPISEYVNSLEQCHE